MPKASMLLTACGLLLALSACAASPTLDSPRAECRLDPSPLSCAAEIDAETRKRS